MKAEALAKANAIFNQLDKNNDGMIVKDEIRTAIRTDPNMQLPGLEGADAEGKIDEFFAQLDSNDDNKISRAEFQAFFGNMIDTLLAAFSD